MVTTLGEYSYWAEETIKLQCYQPPQHNIFIVVLFLEHMVLKLEQILGSKNSITLLRHLALKPYLASGLTELSRTTGISKSNLLRVLLPLMEEKIALKQFSGRKQVLRINGEHNLVSKLWELFMLEKQANLSPMIKNAIDQFYLKIKNRVQVFVVFGSVARGKEKAESDVDILIVGDEDLAGPKTDFLPIRFEVHNYSWNDLEEKKDLIVLDCLTNGIAYKGNLFGIVKELKTFPKNYLLYRLSKSKEFLRKARSLKGEAQQYYFNLAKVSLGEIESLYKQGKVLSKSEIKTKATFKKIAQLEAELAKEGDNIWLI